jgi:hypothetical protein
MTLIFVYEEVQREANAFSIVNKKMQGTKEPFTQMSTQSILRYMSAVIRGIADANLLSQRLSPTISLEL